MRRILFCCCLLLVTVSMSANAIYGEKKVRLSQGWEFVKGEWSGIDDVIASDKAANMSSTPQWTKVCLPHCYNSEDAVDPDVVYYKGIAWYRTTLSIDNPYPQGRTILEFEGAGQKVQVYVYDELVATHIGGYDAWMVDITDAVKRFKNNTASEKYQGGIPIAVRCDNRHDEELIPSDLSDFNLYGGIYRHVNLVYLPEVGIEHIHVTPQLSNNRKRGSLSVEISLYNPLQTTGSSWSYVIKDPQGKVVGSTKDLSVTDNHGSSPALSLKGKPQLWDVNNPQMYTCVLTLNNENTKQTFEIPFGFRETQFVEHGPFMLNGRRLLLHGTHRHEDHPGVGAAMTDAQMRRDMLQMKEMGVNFIRLGHYQQSDLILHLCDSLGILVWEESPWCRNYVTSTFMKDMSKRMLRQMILQHYNHPSVILWGMGNEVDWLQNKPYYDKQVLRDFLKEMVDISHSLDPSRMTSMRRCDFARDIVDVYSPSIWAGWYKQNFHDYAQLERGGFENTSRFIHAEWGGDSHVGRHTDGDFNEISVGDKNGDWSESYIVKLFDWHLKEQEKMPWLTGACFWTFKDFSTPLRPTNPIPYVNQKGVVQRDNTPKESFYVFQSYWTATPMVHIYGHSWPVRPEQKDGKYEILVYSNCEEVELLVNGVSTGVRHRNTDDYPAAGFHWDVALRHGDNTIKAIARQGKTMLTDEIHQVVQPGTWGAPASIQLSSVILEDGSPTLQALLVDAQGKICLDSRDVVEFGCTRPDALLINQGTATGSKVIQLANGRAYIRVLKQDRSCGFSAWLRNNPNVCSGVLTF